MTRSRPGTILRSVYRLSAYLLALAVAVQVALIAFGAFALEHEIDSRPVADGDTTGVRLHQTFALVVLFLAVVLFAVSLAAGIRHGVWWAATALGLVLLQFALAYAADSAPIIGLLHGVNALAVFTVALLAGTRVGSKATKQHESSQAQHTRL